MARIIQVKEGDFTVRERVEVIYENIVTAFGTSGKVGVPKKYIGKRAYIVIVKG